FSLDPEESEVKPMRKLAEKHDVDAVITGHTHAAPWYQQDKFVYVNTGTWISLMRLPGEQAGDADWLDWIEELRSNPQLDPSRQNRVRTESRLTAFVADEAPEGGAKIALAESDAHGVLSTLRHHHLWPRAASR